MNFYAASPLFNFFTSVILGTFVFFKNPRRPLNKSYGLLSLSIAFWSGNYFLWQISADYSHALLHVRLLSIGSIFIPVFFLFFILCLLKKQHKKKKYLRAAFAGGLLLTLVSFSRIFISGLRPKLSFRFWPDAGPVYFFFLVFFFVCVLYAVYLLMTAHAKSGDHKLDQIRYVLIASIVGFVGGSTNYPLWYNVPLPPVLNFLVGVHVLILAYAIVKHRLMDIPLVVTRATIFLFVYGLVLGVPFVLSTSGKQWLMNLFAAQWWLVPLMLMATLGTFGPFIYLFLRNKAEALILRDQQTCRKTLKLAAVDMTRIRNFKELLNFICATITKAGISGAGVYFLGKERFFELKSSLDMSGLPSRIPFESEVIRWLNRHKEPLIAEEMKIMLENDENDNRLQLLVDELNECKAEMLVPCFLKNELVEIMILGKKKSGRGYTQEDIDVFAGLGAEAALATENSLLYDKIENEVKERTTELVETQKQLVQAEKLATVGTLAGGVAHEINNPLTAILTNVQMLLTCGPDLDADTKESLELMEEATKRCKTIVQKLMTYAKRPMGDAEQTRQVNLATVLKNVTAFLGYQFKQDNVDIDLETNLPDCFIQGNQNEIEQVITNIFLNAKDAIKKVKKQDSIHVHLAEAGENYSIVIKDEGSGIPPEVLPKIFDPFFTTKEVGKGVGLGLSISQSIVEKHGGTITVVSEAGKGSVFTIRLPKIQAAKAKGIKEKK